MPVVGPKADPEICQLSGSYTPYSGRFDYDMVTRLRTSIIGGHGEVNIEAND